MKKYRFKSKRDRMYITETDDAELAEKFMSERESSAYQMSRVEGDRLVNPLASRTFFTEDKKNHYTYHFNLVLSDSEYEQFIYEKNHVIDMIGEMMCSEANAFSSRLPDILSTLGDKYLKALEVLEYITMVSLYLLDTDNISYDFWEPYIDEKTSIDTIEIDDLAVLYDIIGEELVV